MSIIIDFMRGASVSKLTIKAEKKYLVLPVGKYVDSRKLVLVHDGKTAVDIDLRLDYVNPSEYVCLDISKYRGDELTVEVLQDVIPEVPLVKDTTPQPTLTQYCKKATFG